jgi:hypothetical protein
VEFVERGRRVHHRAEARRDCSPPPCQLAQTSLIGVVCLHVWLVSSQGCLEPKFGSAPRSMLGPLNLDQHVAYEKRHMRMRQRIMPLIAIMSHIITASCHMPHTHMTLT